MLFKIFLWKNFKQLKFYFYSIIILLFSSLFILSLYFYSTLNIIKNPTTIFEPKNMDLLKSYFTGGADDVIYYYPSNNDFLDELMEKVRLDLSLTSDRIISFPSKDELNLNFEVSKNTRSFSIIFNEYPNSLSEAIQSKKLNYSLSSTTSKISTLKKFHNDDNIVAIKEHDDYIGTGYFILQHIIDFNYYMLTTEKHPNFELEVAPVPHHESIDLDSFRVISYGVLFALLFYVILLITFVIPLVEEKQNKTKEIISLATPYHFEDDICFLFLRLFIYLAYAGIAIFIGEFFKALGTSCIVFVIVIVLLFISASICYSILIANLFKKAFTSKIGGFLLLLGPCFAFFFESESPILIHCLHSSAFYEGFKILQIFTNKHKDLDMNSLFESVTETNYKLSNIYLLLILQSLAYLFVHTILSNTIFRGEFNSFNFIDFIKVCTTNGIKNEDPINEEKEVALRITNLTKRYKKRCRGVDNVAVKNLNMEVKNKCITVLLGHNGAGKTTLIKTVVGILKPTSGTITIFDEVNISQSKYKIGFCPQQDVYMKYLTCKEHIEFFSQLRGSVENAKDTDNLLEKLHLTDEADYYGGCLSGGMRRRLCLGIAVVGNPRIIILDEPSSGLDPESRRKLWDILLNLRKTKAILVTTHHMEEAEVLGDYVSIVAHGKLIRYGKALELKKKHGCGYILKLLITNKCNVSDLINKIKDIIPNATKKSLSMPTLCVTLPYAHKGSYSKLLKKLEESALDLEIENISIADTSLEDVFFNCEATLDEIDSRVEIPYEELKNFERSVDSPNALLLQQISAIFYKKRIFVQREWVYVLLMCLLPILASFMSFIVLSSSPSNAKIPTLDLNLNFYEKNEIYLKIDKNLVDMRSCLEEKLSELNITPIFLHNNLNITNELLLRERKELDKFHEKVIGAIEISKNIDKISITMLYSRNFIHSSVMILNFIDNIILNWNSCKMGEIDTTFSPFERINENFEISPFRLEYYNHIMPIGFFLYIMLYLCLPYREEKSGFKNLQPITGRTYWLSFTSVDFLQHFIICCIVYVLHYLCLPNNTYGSSELVWIMLAFLFYGLCYLPILYNLSRMFGSLSSLSSFLFMIFIISTISPLITSANLDSIKKHDSIISILSFISPDFLLKHQLRIINENYFINRHNRLTKEASSNSISMHNNELNLFTFFVYAICIFTIWEIILIFIWENINRRQFIVDGIKKLTKFCCCCTKKKIENNNETQTFHSNVNDENKEKVNNLFKGNAYLEYPLVVKNITKIYNTGKCAVNGMNFYVDKGECFGLLGLNGAGKTTMFEMLTENQKITDGIIKIYGIDILNQRNLYKMMFGYCPQGDALDDFMTSYETLKYMGMLRGVHCEDLNKVALKMLEEFSLSKYKNIPVKNYSGGTKRKLSAAIATIGNAKLILLDEPTTGVDPISKKFIWNSIRKSQNNDRAIVLTSHSMDECENLCNRLGIMSNGQFRCVGYIQSLKKEFGSGYTLTIHLKDDTLEDTTAKLINELPKHLMRCKLRERHAGILTFFIEDKIMNWSNIFTKVDLSLSKFKSVIIDYSLNEVSLEDVFLNFDNSKSHENV